MGATGDMLGGHLGNSTKLGGAQVSELAGAVGAIWGAANAMPKEAVALYNFIAERKLTEAAALWEKMLPSQLFFWTHDYNPSIKAACKLAGRMLGECRKPQQPLSKAALAELSKALEPLWTPVRQVA